MDAKRLSCNRLLTHTDNVHPSNVTLPNVFNVSPAEKFCDSSEDSLGLCRIAAHSSVWMFLRFLPVERKFFLATVAKCLLMWDLLQLLGSNKFNYRLRCRPSLHVKCLDIVVILALFRIKLKNNSEHCTLKYFTVTLFRASSAFCSFFEVAQWNKFI